MTLHGERQPIVMQEGVVITDRCQSTVSAIEVPLIQVELFIADAICSANRRISPANNASISSAVTILSSTTYILWALFP
jgi:hypothetical protein